MRNRPELRLCGQNDVGKSTGNRIITEPTVSGLPLSLGAERQRAQQPILREGTGRTPFGTIRSVCNVLKGTAVHLCDAI